MISSLVRAYREDDLFPLTGDPVNPFLVRRSARDHPRNGQELIVNESGNTPTGSLKRYQNRIETQQDIDHSVAGNRSHLYQARSTNTELERPMKIRPDSRVMGLKQSTPDIAVT